MKHPKLSIIKRKVLGKKTKKLRREGILPANIYGKDFKSVSVQTDYKEFNKIFKEAGETGLVDIELEGKTIPVLIHNVQTDYKNTPLHADFYKVNLKEKVKTMVPLEFIGEPKAVVDKLGILMEIMHEVEVEALPEELPEKIEVNVEILASVNEQITISDLKKPQGVEILTDATQVIAKIGDLISKETAEEAAAEEAAAEEAAAEAAKEDAADATEGATEGTEISAEAAPVEEKKEE